MIKKINKVLLALVAVLIICSDCLAQPEAKIVGPNQAPAGELVVLASTGSTGDNLVWVRPEDIQTVQAGCSLLDTQIFFATTKLGKYEFMLIVADKDAKISYAKHVVEITRSAVSPTPVDPDPPVVAPPADPSRWAGLQVISKSNADRLNDNATRTRLKAALAAAVLDLDAKCAGNNCPTAQAAMESVRKAIEAVLLTRVGQSAMIDWTSWRSANQAEMNRVRIVDVKDYLLAVKAMSAGL